jgi:hypothetical protein
VSPSMEAPGNIDQEFLEPGVDRDVSKIFA